ncbi:MAG: type II secretion system protein N [Woeseiaceae bacterium]
MIHSKRRLLLVAGITVITGLVLMFPSRIAYRWAAPTEVSLSGLSGTVWNGQAGAGLVKGVYLKDIGWRFKPLGLFTGKIVYRVEAAPASGFIESNLGVGIGGKLTVSDLKASLPLQPLSGALQIRGLRGNASLQFERIRLQDNLPVAADGILEVRDLLVPRIARDPIGGYRIEFFSQDDGIAASVEDTDGVVDIAGSLQVNADRSYQFLAQVAAKPEASQRLKTQMQYLPPANDRGQQELRIEGSL